MRRERQEASKKFLAPPSLLPSKHPLERHRAQAAQKTAVDEDRASRDVLGGVARETAADWTTGLAQWAEGQLAVSAAPPLLSEALPAFERTLIVTALRRARGKRLAGRRRLRAMRKRPSGKPSHDAITRQVA